MSALLERMLQHGAASRLDLELARTLCRLARCEQPELALAVALASREVQAGHVCLELARIAGQPAYETEAGEPGPSLPALAPWLAALARAPFVSQSGLEDPARPLVLAGTRLYLARYFEHEQQVAAQLLRRARATLPAPPHSSLLERLFPARPRGIDLQRDAALTAREHAFSVIVGGPGTGKTSTVVKLLALIVEDALALGQRPPRTLLVAPTGKAAQRLSEAIERARDGLPLEEPVRQAIETRASTLHRALGPIEGSLTRFRHGPERPLDAELVLLDEASMVDLALMRRFLDALPAHARLILLGDPDQLASVEAGGVLSDLCRAAESPSSPLYGSVSRLRESYRYPADSGIARLAHAVHAQSFDQLQAVLAEGHADVTLHPPPRPNELGRTLEQEARAHYAGLRESDLTERLCALDRFRVLCAHRKGPQSVEQLTPLLSRALAPGQRGRAQSYAGRPLLITQNDYATQLFNGDVGVVHPRGGARRRELMACFRASAGGIREIAVARLPEHESAYAMTVHKSQGSEFDRVAIVLPERPSPVLSRELLYTAITRAKQAVTLYASEASLKAALSQRVERSSGLVERLS